MQAASLPLLGAALAASAAESIFASNAQEKAASGTAQSARRSALFEQAQTRASAATQKQGIGYRSRQLLGEIRALAAEGNTAGSVSARDVEASSLVKALIDSETVNQNTNSQLEASRSRAVSFSQVAYNQINPGLSLNTLATGLGLFSGLDKTAGTLEISKLQ